MSGNVCIAFWKHSGGESLEFFRNCNMKTKIIKAASTSLGELSMVRMGGQDGWLV